MNDIVVIQKDDLVEIIQNAIKKALDFEKMDKYAKRNKFSPKEAAEFTNRSEAFIRKLISTNQIPYEKEGKPVILFRKDLLPLKK